MKFIAYCTKGLEDVAQAEIVRELKGSTIIKRSTKRIIFESNADYELLSSLRTVDDIAIFVDKIDISGISKLNSIVDRLAEIDIPKLYDELKLYREVVFNKFSLTVALLNYKRFQRDELKDALSKKLSEKYSLEYLPREHTNFDLRINIENNIAWVGVRLTPDSLFNRKYKVNNMMGSLKATIAAAMVALATQSQLDLKVVDNYCGSGTILCEALIVGNEVYGGDLSEFAVKSTIANLEGLKYDTSEKIVVQDASNTNWPDKSFDCAISNLPWGKQVEIDSITDLYEGCIKDYSRTVKDGGVICLILTKPDLMRSLISKYCPNSIVKEYQIGFLGQRPTIMVVKTANI